MARGGGGSEAGSDGAMGAAGGAGGPGGAGGVGGIGAASAIGGAGVSVWSAWAKTGVAPASTIAIVSTSARTRRGKDFRCNISGLRLSREQGTGNAFPVRHEVQGLSVAETV